MQCTSCQCENLSDASFCQECGARFALVCGGCQTANSPASKFCRKCGTRFGPAPAGAAAPAAVTAAPPIQPGTVGADGLADTFVPSHLQERFRNAHAAQITQHADERKIITALFADIKGSMALLDDMDPERARELIDPALRVMMNAVYRYEGYVAQALGDGIFALFGAPLAHEDHARRAIYAALSMQEQMKQYGAQMLRDHGLPPLQIRVGINTGEVVVRSIATGSQRADYVPIGHSTGLAARIEGMATPGTVLVSGSTHRLTEGFFEFRPLGAVPMKGVSKAIELYEVTGIGPMRTRLEVSASHGLSRFVGRDQELERMQLMLDQSRAGRGQIIGVIGEAGVGKSRLCHEFKQMNKSGCLLLECSSDSYGKAFPFMPLIDLLKNFLQIAPADDARRILEKTTGRVLALDRELDDTIPFLLSLMGVADPARPVDKMDPQIRRRRIFNAIERLVLREALNQPVLMVMEDLHWIDEETQGFLTAFGRAVEGARVLLLVNYRPEYQPRWDGGTTHSQLRLNAFGRDEADALLAALLGSRADLDDLKRLILEKTQGNPFFMEEYVQTLLDQGVLTRGAEITLARPLSTIEMPATVQGVLAARIDRLQAEEKGLLQMLAVLGAASPLRLIERLEFCSQARLGQVLGKLQSAEFIHERPAFPDVEYVFKHALIRETAYGELVDGARHALHSRVAQAMQAHYGEREDEHCGELAHHYACSDNLPKAVDFLRRAGAQSMQISAYASAITHLSLALAMLHSLADPLERDAQELQLQSMLGAALMATRGFAATGVGPAFERARALCRDTTSTAELVRVLSGLGLLYINMGELRKAREIGTQLLELAARRQEPDLFVSGHEMLGLATLRAGALVECRSHMTLAMQRFEAARNDSLRDSLGRDPAVSCAGFGAMGLWLLGYPDQALAGAAQALQAAHSAKQRHPFTVAYALLSSVWIRQFRGQASIALQEAGAATEFATEQGFPTWLAHGLVVQGWAEAEHEQSQPGQGRAQTGLVMIDRGLQEYEASGAKVWAPLFQLLRAKALVQCGRNAEALDAITRAIAIAQAFGGYWWGAELFRVRGELLLSTSMEHAAQARECFETALRIARAQSARSLELRACASLVRLTRHEGVSAQAEQELKSLYEWFSEGLATADLQEARELLGERSGQPTDH